jgi:hypothetical protein
VSRGESKIGVPGRVEATSEKTLADVGDAIAQLVQCKTIPNRGTFLGSFGLVRHQLHSRYRIRAILLPGPLWSSDRAELRICRQPTNHVYPVAPRLSVHLTFDCITSPREIKVDFALELLTLHTPGNHVVFHSPIIDDRGSFIVHQSRRNHAVVFDLT